MDHWNEKDIDFTPSKAMIQALSSSPFIADKRFLWAVGVLFFLTFGLLACIAIYPFLWKESDNFTHTISLLQTFLTILGVAFAMSYTARKSQNLSPRFFLEEFFEDSKIEKISKNFTKIQKSKYSDYKMLLKYNKDNETQIGYNLEYDNFFIYSHKNKIEKITQKNNLEKFGNSSLWLGKNCSGSYNERISQLREYIDFVEKNF